MILGREDSLEEGMATHSSIHAWRISMDRGACQAIAHGITKSQTQPKCLSTAQWQGPTWHGSKLHQIYYTYCSEGGFPEGSVGKEYTCNAEDTGDTCSIPRSERSRRRKWQPTPVFLPGESHGQSNLVGYSPKGPQRAGHD